MKTPTPPYSPRLHWGITARPPIAPAGHATAELGGYRSEPIGDRTVAAAGKVPVSGACAGELERSRGVRAGLRGRRAVQTEACTTVQHQVLGCATVARATNSTTAKKNG